MFERILVPLDGSLRAERALPVAARLARASLGTIVLLRVVRPPINTTALHSPMASRSERVTVEVTRATHYLDQVVHFPILKGLSVQMHALVGSVAETILSLAEAVSSDLIILCRHGEISTTGRIPGSIAEKLAHYATVPVLILHEGGPIPVRPYREGIQPFCALVPLDGSPRAQAALEPAAEVIAALSSPSRARLHLLHVVHSRGAGSIAFRQQPHQQAQHYLKVTDQRMREGAVAPRAKQLGLTITWSVATDTHVTEALLRAAEGGMPFTGTGIHASCDLIAVTTHRPTHLPYRVVGEVSRRLLYETRLPILMVHPAEIAGEMVETNDRDTGVPSYAR